MFRFGASPGRMPPFLSHSRCSGRASEMERASVCQLCPIDPRTGRRFSLNGKLCELQIADPGSRIRSRPIAIDRSFSRSGKRRELNPATRDVTQSRRRNRLVKYDLPRERPPCYLPRACIRCVACVQMRAYNPIWRDWDGRERRVSMVTLALL